MVGRRQRYIRHVLTRVDLVSMNETLNFALAGLFNLSFAGVPFLLLGLSVASLADCLDFACAMPRR